MIDKKITGYQIDIARKEDELKKDIDYAESLFDYIRSSKWASKSFDVDSILIRIEFYISIFRSFIFEVERLNKGLSKIKDLSDENHINSVNLSLQQGNMLAIQATSYEQMLIELEKDLSKYSDAVDESIRIQEANKLIEFQEKINKLRGEKNNE